MWYYYYIDININFSLIHLLFQMLSDVVMVVIRFYVSKSLKQLTEFGKWKEMKHLTIQSKTSLSILKGGDLFFGIKPESR